MAKQFYPIRCRGGKDPTLRNTQASEIPVVRDWSLYSGYEQSHRTVSAAAMFSD